MTMMDSSLLVDTYTNWQELKITYGMNKQSISWLQCSLLLWRLEEDQYKLFNISFNLKAQH
jgi:hypothetical protein